MYDRVLRSTDDFAQRREDGTADEDDGNAEDSIRIKCTHPLFRPGSNVLIPFSAPVTQHNEYATHALINTPTNGPLLHVHTRDNRV
jgi:hypothetical protein